MKNIVIKLLGLLFLFSVSNLFSLKAEEVRLTDIKKVALNAFSGYSGITQNESKIVREIPVIRQDTILFYVFNFDEGFIMVAADNASVPILGYSVTSGFDFNDVPPALHYLLEGYKEEIVHAKRVRLRASPEIKKQWDDLLSENSDRGAPPLDPGIIQTQSLYTPGTWLLETVWDQQGGKASNSTITYNHYCPATAQGPKTLVGCGGVALAQILNFYKCRIHPQGPPINYTLPGLPPININLANETYNWNNMLPGQANLDNAKLLYHSAAALQSGFGLLGTSSFIRDIPTALSTYFGFGFSFVNDRSIHNDNAWINLLKGAIDGRRPIFYSGDNQYEDGGHTWVVDGYNNNNHFHCNWGWGGKTNGWFNLSNLTAIGEGNYNFNYKQKAITGATPNYYSYYKHQNMTIACNTFIGHSFQIANCKIANNSQVFYEAECSIEIFGTFEVPLGSTLEMKMK